MRVWSRTGSVLRYCRGMQFNCVAEIGRCTAWLPMYAISSIVFAVNSCWRSKFQRSEYGLLKFGLRKLTVWPAYVPSPGDDPTGCWIPLGNGLLNDGGGRQEVDWWKR